MWPPELQSILCGPPPSSWLRSGSSEVRERVIAVGLTVATSANWRESWSVPATVTVPPCYTPTGHSGGREGKGLFLSLRGRRQWGEEGAIDRSRNSKCPRKHSVKVARAHPGAVSSKLETLRTRVGYGPLFPLPHHPAEHLISICSAGSYL